MILVAEQELKCDHVAIALVKNREVISHTPQRGLVKIVASTRNLIN